MSTRLTVPRAEWKPFFDRLSKALLGKWAEIEVASLDLGDQILAEWIPLLGISYDERSDQLDVALDRTTHWIQHPNEVIVDENTSGLTSIAVVDREGTRQVIRLKDPLALPTTGVPA